MRSPSQHALPAGDVMGLLGMIEKAQKRCGLSAAARVLSALSEIFTDGPIGWRILFLNSKA